MQPQLLSVELDVEQSRGVVCALQETAEPNEVKCLILEHRADRDSSRQVRAELHPLKKLLRIAHQQPFAELLLQSEPGVVVRLPHLGRQ